MAGIPRGLTGNVLRGLTGLVVLFVIVDLVVRLGIVDSAVFPSPWAVVRRAGGLITTASFWPEIWVTLYGALIGLVIATVVGVGLGALFSSSRSIDRLFSGVRELARPLPAVALAPLLLAVFGRGLTSRSIAVAFAAMWPIMFNTIAGLRSPSPVSIESATAMGLARWERLRRVQLPAALPFVFTGIKVASTIAVIVEVSVEILLPDAERAGLGGFIALNSIAGFGLADREAVYAATLISGLLGLVVAQGLETFEHRWFAWSRQGKR